MKHFDIEDANEEENISKITNNEEENQLLFHNNESNIVSHQSLAFIMDK